MQLVFLPRPWRRGFYSAKPQKTDLLRVLVGDYTSLETVFSLGFDMVSRLFTPVLAPVFYSASPRETDFLRVLAWDYTLLRGVFSLGFDIWAAGFFTPALAPGFLFV